MSSSQRNNAECLAAAIAISVMFIVFITIQGCG